MALFGTDEWVEDYVKALNDNPKYLDAAKTWEGDFLFTVTAEGALDHDFQFYLGLFHGKATKGYIVGPDGPKEDAPFKVSGKYNNWVEVLTKKLDPVQALMQGKLKLTGNMGKVMRAVKAAQELVNSLGLAGTDLY